jgi:hypothetical protein
MGFRFGWFGKWGGGTWGPKGGLRLYGWTGGRRRKTGCLIPLVVLTSGGLLACTALLALLR